MKYIVVVVKRFDLPATVNDLPKHGEIVGNAVDVFKSAGIESFYQNIKDGLEYTDAIEMARGYNTGELAFNPKEQGTWAVVLDENVEVTPGTMVELQTAATLN